MTQKSLPSGRLFFLRWEELVVDLLLQMVNAMADAVFCMLCGFGDALTHVVARVGGVCVRVGFCAVNSAAVGCVVSGVFYAAQGLLSMALHFIDCAGVGHLLVAERIANGLLEFAFCFVENTFCFGLVHDESPGWTCGFRVLCDQRAG